MSLQPGPSVARLRRDHFPVEAAGERVDKFIGDGLMALAGVVSEASAGQGGLDGSGERWYKGG
jgi:class 3 adenylate cyclase